MIPLIPTASEISHQRWCWAKKQTTPSPFILTTISSLIWSWRCHRCDKARIRNINKRLTLPRRTLSSSFYLRSGECSTDERRRVAAWSKKRCVCYIRSQFWTRRTRCPTGFSRFCFWWQKQRQNTSETTEVSAHQQSKKNENFPSKTSICFNIATSI